MHRRAVGMQFRLVYPTSLAPYMLIPRAGTALVFSFVFTLAALLIFGYVKGRFTGARPIRSAIQTAPIGGLAAAVAFSLAKVISR
jgi:VIT1/CCC1 family predicted Fe2+/Mn2+ transporter